MNKNSIELTKEQRQTLEQIVSKGQAAAQKIRHAHILLKIDSGEDGADWSDEQIQKAFGVTRPTIWRIRRRFLEHGLEDAITRRPQPERPEKRKVNGEQEAYVIALTCSQAPEGYKRWSLRLLANKLVELGYFEEISHKTVWAVLKKINSSHG